jgi:serine phosphatase RsbU (regulator of sigma subunit)
VKKHWFHSITARLLLFAGISVLISVVGISAFTGIKFYTHLQTEFRKETQRTAAEAANSIRSSVEFWLSSLSIGMHNMFIIPEQERVQFAEAFLRSNTEFVAFQLVRTKGNDRSKVFAMTSDDKEVRFQAESLGAVRNALRSANVDVVAIAEKQKQTVMVWPLSGQMNLPLMSVGMRFEDGRTKETYWGVLSVWQTRILRSLPASEESFGVVLNAAKSMIMSRKEDLDWDNFRGILDTEATSESSVRGNSRDGQTYIAGQSAVPDLGMHVAVIKNATMSIQRINQIIVNSVSWTSVYVLCLLFVAYFAAGGITSKLKRTIDSTQQIAQGNFDTKIAITGKDEVSDLGRAVNQMAVQIKSLLASRVEAARQEKELETARLVQSTFFPKDQAESRMFSFVGHNIPASECGGDWWGRVGFDGRYEYILIADATGHGAGAALVTAMAYSGCMTLNEFLAHAKDSSGLMSPGEVLTTLNKVLWTAGKGTTSMTCFCALVDTETGVMRFANGGHCMPVIVSPEGKVERSYKVVGRNKNVKTRTFSLISRGDPLGFEPTVSYDESEIELKAGDKVFLYTDGLLENNNKEQVPLGKAKFNKMIAACVDTSAEKMVGEVVREYVDYIGSEAPIDDVTVVVAEVLGDWQQKRMPGAA